MLTLFTSIKLILRSDKVAYIKHNLQLHLIRAQLILCNILRKRDPVLQFYFFFVPSNPSVVRITSTLRSQILRQVQWMISLDKLLNDNTIEEDHWRKLKQKSSLNSAWVVGLVAAIGGFLYGFDTGLINDLLEMKYVMETFPSNKTAFNTHERALITAILSLGTLSGSILAPLISDNYGRKFLIILSSAIIFNIGNVFQTASSTITFLCIGRAISGIGIGMLSAVVPLYQAEASPKWVRGSIVFTYQWAITWGLLIALAICQGTRRMSTSASYRIPIGIQFLWAIALSTGMFFLPESPRYYVQKNDIEKALLSLSKLRRLPTNDADLIEELVEIKANYDYELSFGKTTILDCFRNGGGRHKQILRMFTGIGVQAFQQSSGINFIFYYGTNFFSQAGVPSYYIFSFITYCVNTVFTIPGILLVDVLGRRKLLIFGGVGMAVANLIIAIVGVCVESRRISSTICVSFSCIFIAFFASTWGGCTWALTSDIYGISIRQKAMSITTSTNWLMNFIFAYITPYLIDTGYRTASLGTSIFFIWGGLNVCGTIFCFFTVYETKGLKLEEVDYMYLHCNNARSSTKFKSTKIDYQNYDAIPSEDKDNEKELDGQGNGVLDTMISQHSMTSTDLSQGNKVKSNQDYYNFIIDSLQINQSSSNINEQNTNIDDTQFIKTGDVPPVTMVPILNQPNFDSDSDSTDSSVSSIISR